MSDHEHEDLPSVDADAAQARELFERLARPADDFAIGTYTCPTCGCQTSFGAVEATGMPMPRFVVTCCGRLIEILPTGEP